MNELKFLAGAFFDFEIPKDKKYLFKYFRSPIEKQFIKYYLCFSEIDYFVEHTGYFCQKRWLLILKKRFDFITEFHHKCKSSCNEEGLELLRKIEEGKYKFKV
jgi:hypothetical protein